MFTDIFNGTLRLALRKSVKPFTKLIWTSALRTVSGNKSMNKLIAGVLAGALAVPAQAATVVVQARANSITGGTAVVFGPVTSGQTITVSSSTNDLWSAGPPYRISDANGLIGVRYANGSDDSGMPVGTQIGDNYGTYTLFGFTAPYGALVGRIGSSYQLLGANFSGAAWGSGNLELFYWDGYSDDNFGDISFNIAAVPEPSAWALMILGFGMVGGALRSRRKVRPAITFA